MQIEQFTQYAEQNISLNKFVKINLAMIISSPESLLFTI